MTPPTRYWWDGVILYREGHTVAGIKEYADIKKQYVPASDHDAAMAELERECEQLAIRLRALEQRQ